MSKRLSFSIAVNLLTENFKKGADTVKNSLKSIQMQIITFAAALGMGGLGLSGLLTRFRDVARETSRVITALKNVSGGTVGFADNLKFINELANKYGLEVNALTGNFAKFTASATQANMPMEQQKKVFESLSRASTAFGLSADDTNGVFLALSQMMGKGKVSMEELRNQMGEKLPVAMQAMAKAMGVSVSQMDKLISTGKVMSADVLPKFADALNEMIPDVDTDNLEASLNRLSNTFGEIVNASGFQAKYKALIDGFTDLLKSASQNIQNIIVGIIAVFVFVATNALTKIYRGYAATGQQIVANATATHNKLRATIAARVEAEIALENAKLRHAQATGKQQIAIAREVERAKQTLSARTAAVNKAHENAKAAAAQAAAIRSKGAWAIAGAAISGTFSKLGNSIKSLWNSFAPAIVFSGLIALGGYIKSVYDKTKWLEKATEEYNKDLATEQTNINILFNRLRKVTEGTEEYNKIKNEILSKYGGYLKGLSDEVQSLKDVEGAYRAISAAALQAAKDRAIEKNSTNAYDKYTSSFAENATELQKRLSDKFGKEKGTAIYDDILKSLNEDKEIPKEIQKIIDGFNKTYYGSSVTGGGSTSHNPVGQLVNNIRVSKRQLNEELEGIKTAFGEMSVPEAEKEVVKPGGTPEPDAKALRAAEKRLEALRKLDEEDQKRQIEKQKFDNEIREREIDSMVDGYDKRIAQLKLNFDKEDQAIKEFAQKAAKDQVDYAKNKYVSSTGSTKGFEDYYANADLSKIMPDGLKPEDVKKQIDALYSVAKDANKSGLNQINKDIAKSIIEERLQFASEMEQKIYDTQNYYNERRRLVKKGSDEYFELLRLETKSLEEIKSQHNTKLIQMENEYKEKAIELTSELFFFQSDKDAALLQQRIINNQKYIDSLKKELQVLTGLDFDLLDEASLNNLTQAFPELVLAIRKAKLEQKGLNNELAKTPAQKLIEISGLFNQLSGTIGSITGIDFSMLSDSINGIASFASDDFVGAASSGLNIVSTVVTGIIGKMERQAQIQREILKLQQDYNIALRQQNYDLISSIDYARAFKDNMEALHWLIEKGFVSDVDYSVWEELENHAKKASENVKIAQKEYDSLINGASNALNEMWGNRKGLERWQKGTTKILSDWKDGVIDIEEAYRRLDVLGFSGFTDIADQIAKAKDETDKWVDSMIELSNQMDQFVTGTDFDGFLGSTMTAITNLKTGISDLGDFTEETLKNAVLSSFKYKILADALKPMYDRLANLFLADTLDPTAVSQWGIDLQTLTKEYADKLEEVYKTLGLNFEDSNTSQKASSGGFQSMSQETGDRLDGRFAALQMSGLRIEGFLTTISTCNNNILNMSVQSNNELRKHTELFKEMKTIHLNSFYQIEGTKDFLRSINEMMSKIDKNTSRL